MTNPIETDEQKREFLKVLNNSHETVKLSDFEAGFLASCLMWDFGRGGYSEKMRKKIDEMYGKYNAKIK